MIRPAQTTVVNWRTFNEGRHGWKAARRGGLYVDIMRPSVWGNRWSHKEHTLAEFQVPTIADAIAAHARWLLLGSHDMLKRVQQELRGKILVCGCAPEPCHGDIYAWVADASEPEIKAAVAAARKGACSMHVTRPAVGDLTDLRTGKLIRHGCNECAMTPVSHELGQGWQMRLAL